MLCKTLLCLLHFYIIVVVEANSSKKRPLDFRSSTSYDYAVSDMAGSWKPLDRSEVYYSDEAVLERSDVIHPKSIDWMLNPRRKRQKIEPLKGSDDLIQLLQTTEAAAESAIDLTTIINDIPNDTSTETDFFLIIEEELNNNASDHQRQNQAKAFLFNCF